MSLVLAQLILNQRSNDFGVLLLSITNGSFRTCEGIPITPWALGSRAVLGTSGNLSRMFRLDAFHRESTRTKQSSKRWARAGCFVAVEDIDFRSKDLCGRGK